MVLAREVLKVLDLLLAANDAGGRTGGLLGVGRADQQCDQWRNGKQ
jgi:hypothetical protein